MSSLFPNEGVCVVLGVQWGDEGKGKLVDALAQEADIVARCQGGNNAGHTIVVNNTKFDFHMLPSGLINPECISVIGNGVVVHLPSLFKELETLEAKGIQWENRIFVSDRAHVVMNVHQIVDGLREQERGGANIGTTRKGIGPAYSSKASRSGLRIHHVFDFETFEHQFKSFVLNRKKRYGDFEYNMEEELNQLKSFLPKLKPMVIDTVAYFNKAMQSKKKILVEGANAAMLDIDFGTYPYVTSSSTTIGGVCTGLGIPPHGIKEVIGVMKAYTTRVGAGPFPTELTNDLGKHLQQKGHEVGVTTGRPRRCGWLDLVVVQYSHWINGYTQLNLTKLDVLSELKEIQIGVKYMYQGEPISFPADLSILEQCQVEYLTLPGWQCELTHIRSFEELPKQAQQYVRTIEHLLRVPITLVGVGPSRDALIKVPKNKDLFGA